LNTTIKSAVNAASKKLSSLSAELSSLESRILLGSILKIEPNMLLISSDTKILTEEELAKFNEFINRRLDNEPIAYIIGKKEFFGRDFYVNKNVLIPRNDSEILIDALVEDYKKNEHAKVLELGLGSGCLIITALLEFENFYAEAADISMDAIQVAKKNATKYYLNNRLKIFCKDWNEYASDFESRDLSKNIASLGNLSENLFDIIISNPPYIDKYMDKSYKNEELMHEPEIALFVENDGYAKYEELSKILGKLLRDSGSIYIEIGQNMEKKVEQIFFEQNFYVDNIYKDLSGINRCMKFKKK